MIPSFLVLSIAGSDSGAGAGMQADLKTILALGGYGTCAVTALTAQNTCGVQEVFPVPGSFLSRQIQAVWEDLPPQAVKIGMLPGDLDWYLVDKDFTWTYVHTHEADCGPYFCEVAKQ